MWWKNFCTTEINEIQKWFTIEKIISYRIWHRPRFVAKITIGANGLSKARCKYVKHSMSNIWTSSMNSTPGTSSATPWSIYLLTTLLISRRSLSNHANFHFKLINNIKKALRSFLPVISVFFGLINEPIIERISCPPCGRALATSKSCNVTSCTTSFFLCTSPFGNGTYSSVSKSYSVAYVSHRPCL